MITNMQDNIMTYYLLPFLQLVILMPSDISMQELMTRYQYTISSITQQLQGANPMHHHITSLIPSLSSNSDILCSNNDTKLCNILLFCLALANAYCRRVNASSFSLIIFLYVSNSEWSVWIVDWRDVIRSSCSVAFISRVETRAFLGIRVIGHDVTSALPHTTFHLPLPISILPNPTPDFILQSTQCCVVTHLASNFFLVVAISANATAVDSLFLILV